MTAPTQAPTAGPLFLRFSRELGGPYCVITLSGGIGWRGDEYLSLSGICPEADGRFIVDAYAVHDETGKTPRELADEVARIKTLAKQAMFLHSAMWDLADGSGCIVDIDAMKRVDEVFGAIGVATGEIVLDEDDECAMLKPSVLLAERDRLAERCAGLEKDAARFQAYFGGEEYNCDRDSILSLHMDAISGQRPTLDQWRAAIDAAMSAAGEGA